MSEENRSETRNSTVDGAKWLSVVVFVALAVGGNSHFADQPFLYRLIGVVLLLGIALGVATTTKKGADFLQLLKDSRSEVRRVTWPSKQETLTTAGIVSVAVVLSSLILWGIDSALGALVSLLVN